MASDLIRSTARLYALQNAVQFNGAADSKAVIGKVIAALKTLSFSPQEIIPVVREVVNEVNSISVEQQRKELERAAPELLHKEKKERDFSLPALPHAEKGKVVTRFPPEPNGYLHIGHAKAAIVDSEYARMYDGTFILRFDDTNPENAQLEFYDAQKKDLHWLGIEWDLEYNTSDNLKTHYQLAEQLIKQGDAYLCRCTAEQIKQGRFLGTPCACRNMTPKETASLWKEYVSTQNLSNAILRLKADMKSANTAMRDPTLFRVITTPHPRTGTTFHVWPTYDFAGAIEDSISGVTHPFRTKEYELRDEVYFLILKLLNLRQPYLMEFARLSITGMPVSKRKIKPLIENKQVSGFDDVRLPTLQGLKRRGILPEAIKQFVLSQGISKVESEASFSLVEAANRKLLDPQVRRYFFVPNPVKLTVKNAPEKTVHLKLHPTAALGERIIKTSSTFFISHNDVASMKTGDVFRLKDHINVTVTKKGKELSGEYAGDKPVPGTPKIQWTTDHTISLAILVPGVLFKNDAYNQDSLQEVQGVAEEAVRSLHEGDIVQFERFGFVRLEKTKTGLRGVLAHK